VQLIEIERARVYRGETLVFADLSLAIPLGRQTAILGPNGAGKSTLLKLLSQELHPVPCEGSRLRVFGEDRWNVWDLRRRLGIVSHDLQLAYADWVTGFEVLLSGYYASIGVYQHQAYGPAHHARAEQVMAQIGMSPLRDRPYAAMSAGEQRRFLLGRALVHDPAALVLDEPTSGLDLRACLDYLRLVRDLMRQGKTILLVTHHIHEIPPEMTHVVLLKAGQVVGEGPKKELLSGPTLSALFDVPIQVVEAKGWYQILPQS
jgi:iron complex transport system ATP-binding protein